jgi:hypothetical protein
VYPELSESEREKVSAAINRLLAINFVVKEKDRETYMTVRRHREAVERFFHFLKWSLVVDERHECVYVQSAEGGMRVRLTRDQSIWFLVLRLIYQEKRQSLSLSEFPLTTTHEIRTKYETFRMPWVNRTQLDQLVRLCARYQLMDTLDGDVRADDCRFRLFHTWQYAIQAEELATIQEKLRRYDAGAEEGGLLDEMDEEASAD